MVKFKKRLSSVLAVLFTALTCLSSVPVKATEATPKIVFLGVEHSPLVVGDAEVFHVSSVGTEKVQYRVFQNKIGSDKWEELTAGYTAAMNANEITSINGLTNYATGKYKLSFWVKKAGSQGEINGKNGGYDSYYVANLNCVSKDNNNRVYANGDMDVEKDSYVVGDTLKVNGIKNISGMKAPYTYKLHIYDVNNDMWTIDKVDYRDKESITWVPDKAGTYVLDVWAMSASSTLWAMETKLKGRIYEAWKLKVITVKEKVEPTEINIVEKGTIYGSKDEKNPMQISENMNITANDVVLNNVNVKGNVTITGDNAILNNVKVEGTLIVNPGEIGTVNLNNVNATTIEVLSGAANSIHFNNVIAKSLNVNSKNLKEQVRIELKGTTNIEKTTVKSNVILDAILGSFGNVEVLENTNKTESLIELRGTFDKDITVKTKATIQAAKDAKIPKIVIEPSNNEKITLDGNFGGVEVNKKAVVATTESTKIVQITINSNEVTTELGKGSIVVTLQQNGFTIVVTGLGTIEVKIDPPVIVVPPVIVTPPTPTYNSVTGVTLISGSGSMVNGTLINLTANVLPSNANDKSLTWTSSDSSVAVVDATGNPVSLRAKGIGTATITATSVDNKSIKASYVITVTTNVDALIENMITFASKQAKVNEYVTIDNYQKLERARNLDITIHKDSSLGELFNLKNTVSPTTDELLAVVGLALSVENLDLKINGVSLSSYLKTKINETIYKDYTSSEFINLFMSINYTEFVSLMNSMTTFNEPLDIVLEGDAITDITRINAARTRFNIYNSVSKTVTRAGIRAAFELGGTKSLSNMTLNDLKGTYVITMSDGATFTININ